MFDSSALNNALVRWAEKKNLAGVSAAIMSRRARLFLQLRLARRRLYAPRE